MIAPKYWNPLTGEVRGFLEQENPVKPWEPLAEITFPEQETPAMQEPEGEIPVFKVETTTVVWEPYFIALLGILLFVLVLGGKK